MRRHLLTLSLALVLCAGFAQAGGRVFPPDDCTAETPFMSFTALDGANTTCKSGQDILSSALPMCGTGYYVTYNGTAFACKEMDVPSCPSGQVLTHDATGFSCVNKGQAIPTCGANQFLTYNGTAFSCGASTRPVLPVCGAGQAITGIGGTMTCRDLPTSASAPVVTPGSQTYATPGTYTFTIPAYHSITVKLWGAGGGGGGYDTGPTNGFNGTAGGGTRFGASLIANGGGYGFSGVPFSEVGNGGTGGTGSGGTTTSGVDGVIGAIFHTGACITNSGAGAGKGAPHGGGDVNSGSTQAVPSNPGAAPGGGGSGAIGCMAQILNPRGPSYIYHTIIGGGAASGAYVEKTYSSGLTFGQTVTVVVGAGGTGGGGTVKAGDGASGRVEIIWQ